MTTPAISKDFKTITFIKFAKINTEEKDEKFEISLDAFGASCLKESILFNYRAFVRDELGIKTDKMPLKRLESHLWAIGEKHNNHRIGELLHNTVLYKFLEVVPNGQTKPAVKAMMEYLIGQSWVKQK
jgi:hypothetical protein